MTRSIKKHHGIGGKIFENVCLNYFKFGGSWLGVCCHLTLHLMTQSTLKNTITLLLFVAVVLWYSYLGWTDTFYRMGVFLVPIALLATGIIAGALVLYQPKWRPKWHFAFAWVGIIVFAGMVAWHKIDHYKPTYRIYIPETYKGMVTLLPGKYKNESLCVNAFGFGYYAPQRDVNVRVYHGNEEITNALNQYGRGSLLFSLPDSSLYQAIEITCFRVEKGKAYGKSPWNQPHATCIDTSAYLEYVRSGAVIDSLVAKETYPLLRK